MPYSKRHKQDTRERILESARRLFNSRGYSGVTIDEIMNEARLTHGGFGIELVFAAEVPIEAAMGQTRLVHDLVDGYT